ncbi:hypothetical protein JCM10450v2_004702 [Rhodotorula kratochvilovae]
MAGDADFSQLSTLLSSLNQHSQQHDPLVVQPSDTDTAGMSFAELFSHYLAPEVAKLPPSSQPPAPDALPFTFGDDATTGNAIAGPSFSPASTSTFDPSTFMPTLPGSPIGAFSPSSDGNSNQSPMSFPDLDFSATSDPFAIDPSIFSASAGLSYGMPDAAPPATFTPATSVASETPLPSLPNLPLPPLPSLPLAPAEIAPAPLQQQAWAPAAAVELTASGRPKRNVAHTVIDEEDEDDLYSSDGSSATATRKSARASSRKPPAAKKARAGSAGADASAAAEARRLARTSVQPLASSDLHKTTANSKLPPVPQWADKPDPDEYAKLSSKEKRQLRNKMSARNFRHRRKEYITTLEEEISSRDTIIAELRDEVGVIRAENTGLRSEVATLKEKWQDLLDKLSSLSGPVATGTAAAGLGTNPSRAVAVAAAATAVKQEDDAGALSPAPEASTSASGRRMGTRSGGIARPNLTKDVSALGRRGAAAGGWASPGGFGGGFTSVHTTLLPDVSASLLAKPALPPFAAQSFNPALNALTANQLADLPAMTAHLRGGFGGAKQQAQAQQQQPKGTFEDFFASNPYWLRPDQLEQNRAALYGKLANNAAGLVVAAKQAPPSAAQEAYLPVPAGFRPAFFRSPSQGGGKSATAAELLAFQSPATAAAAAASLATPPPVPISHQDAALAAEHALAARLAHVAGATLAGRMWGAFVDAFAGAPAGGMSGEKVAAVLGGRARVEVVPAPAAPAPAPHASDVEALGAQLGGMSLARVSAEDRECVFEGAVGRWLAGGAAPKRA